MSAASVRYARAAIAALALGLASGPAAGADAFEGVFARSPELCRQGIDAIFESGGAVMSAGGILGIEYNCEFMDVRARAQTPGWLATALCEVPDQGFPELLSIMPRGEGELEVNSLRQGDDDANSGMYFRCEGMELP